MKKMLFCALAVVLTACAKESAFNPEAGNPDETVATRSAGDIFKAEKMYTSNSQGFWVDPVGNLWSMYSKGCFFTVPNWEMQFNIAFMAPYNEAYHNSIASCLDAENSLYIITPKNYLIKFNKPDDWATAIDLTPRFPAGTVFIGMSPSSDNTNLFVTTAQHSGSDDHLVRYEKQDLYRVAANGNVTKVVSDIAAPVEPVQRPLHWSGSTDGGGSMNDMKVYDNCLFKANGAFVWGMDCDGQIFKAGTVNGQVQYFTPRVPVQCFTAASMKNNPYALSGNRIIELRPTMASDLVVGNIPATVTGTPVLLLTNADATIFYVITDGERINEYYGTSDQAVLIYKLTL